MEPQDMSVTIDGQKIIEKTEVNYFGVTIKKSHPLVRAKKNI